MEKILFIFKDRPWYLEHISAKFSKNYNLKFFFLSKKIDHSRNQIIKLINTTIKKYKIKKVFFDTDFTSYINANFVSKIDVLSKIALSFDTEENFKKINRSIIAYSHFLTTEPKFIKEFQNKVKCLFIPLETNENLYKKINLKKKYDVLFFGEAKGNRINYINEINKLNIKKKILINKQKEVDDIKLNQLMNESKIVLNFSQGIKKNSNSTYDQFKGRILMSGLAGTLCLSENYESSQYIFKKSFPSFSNIKEMKDKINFLIKNQRKLNEITKSFVNSCKQYSDKYYNKVLFKFLNRDEKSKKLDLNFSEILNIIKISSKKNNIFIFALNVKEILIELFNSKKKNNLIYFLPLFIIALIYLILNIKKNIKKIYQN